MLTKISEVTPDAVTITSADENVKVTIERTYGGHPKGPLSRQEAHDALVKVEDATNEFLAAVEGDLHATSSN